MLHAIFHFHLPAPHRSKLIPRKEENFQRFLIKLYVLKSEYFKIELTVTQILLQKQYLGCLPSRSPAFPVYTASIEQGMVAATHKPRTQQQSEVGGVGVQSQPGQKPCSQKLRNLKKKKEASTFFTVLIASSK